MREEVLLRKLLADGEGTGEERRFQIVIQLLRNLRSPSTANKADAIKVLKNIELMELSMRKQRGIAEMSEKQTLEYEEMAAMVDKEISHSREKMSQAKTELAAARLVRRNRHEYDLLAKMIDDIPSRSETTRKLQEMQEELAQQQERQKQLEAMLSERRNHLHALNIILANFQKLLADEDDTINSDSLDAVDKKDEDREEKNDDVEFVEKGKISKESSID